MERMDVSEYLTWLQNQTPDIEFGDFGNYLCQNLISDQIPPTGIDNTLIYPGKDLANSDSVTSVPMKIIGYTTSWEAITNTTTLDAKTVERLILALNLEHIRLSYVIPLAMLLNTETKKPE